MDSKPLGALTNQAIDGNMASQPEASLSIIDLILKADSVVMLIMFVLVLASIVSWAIMFERNYALIKLKNNFKKFETLFWSGVTLENIQSKFMATASSPIERIFVRVMNERDRCLRDGFAFEFTQERIANITELSLQRETEALEGHTSFLATIGSVAPFIGLFGTVWGIMNSFTAIANTNNTSLAVVAPGIAEALFVTAMGLAAAIPAVIAYNRINQSIDQYYNKISHFSDELNAILNKHLYENIKKA
ncbi:MAG: biopolymer transport protein TolQ [Alphaproteobacteria bacterium]|jgi:biopolymer transport protein TolQ